jgi:hypothetical protein
MCFSGSSCPTIACGTVEYSYNMGAVHFTVTSSEHDFTPGSDQQNWVLSPWIVFTSHRPLYITACANLPLQHTCSIESPMFQALQVAWEDVLIQHNVTLVATAHIHYYERSCPVAHGVCVNDGSAPFASSAAPVCRRWWVLPFTSWLVLQV